MGQKQKGQGFLSALLIAAAAAAAVSGSGDEHYFPSNSLIMSVLPHGWLSKANPGFFHTSRGALWPGALSRVCVCVLHACFARVQPSFPAFIYSLAALFTPFSPLKHPL